ncbi:ChbG/HpnK family deacetylase [Pullulanibacillus sp. KACC 23026]|uniref:ChbG/HpnK family deacetylase n=1 Tax=Pullulanibacillus sp. KACC 23026 TaxID=3028315 RepID=UPI0023B0D627|nr:ChbG/HpnK family deacetylase [Pullulanibacillus sp. KACC 23026]WEG12211.1 ChbG/HpnK family deacetylase [Pullulanibacillus sp. KACC 23026]
MNLIVHADDFGLTENVSLGIIHGMKNGVITETSALVTAPGFEKSVALAKKNDIRKMGMHLLATMGYSKLPAVDIPTLVNYEGRFFNRDEFFEKSIDANELELELTAQIEYFLTFDLELTHLDTHHGFMLKNEEVLEVFIRLAKKYKVPLRNEVSLLIGDEKAYLQKKLDDNKIKTVEMVYFNQEAPYHTKRDIVHFLEEAKAKYCYVEIGCHPGYSDDQLRSLSILNDYRERELELFLDKELRQTIELFDIDLIDYTTLRRL